MVALSETEAGALVATVSVSSGTELSGASAFCLLSEFSEEVACEALMSVADVTCEAVLSTAEISDNFFCGACCKCHTTEYCRYSHKSDHFCCDFAFVVCHLGVTPFLIIVYHANYFMSSLNSIRYDALFKKFQNNQKTFREFSFNFRQQLKNRCFCVDKSIKSCYNQSI